MSSGIYKITNTVNDKCYIGSAVNIKSRFTTHKSFLRQSKHPNLHLRSAWNKYGEENFKFEIIELCIKDMLLDREQFWIDLYNSYELGYNKRKDVNSNLGIKFGKQTKEHIEKRMSKVRGKPRSLEAILNNANARKGKRLSDAHKLSLSESGIGRYVSDETKAKIGVANSRPDKWPHKDKYKCKCRECAEKRYKAKRISRDTVKKPAYVLIGNINVQDCQTP